MPFCGPPLLASYRLARKIAGGPAHLLWFRYLCRAFKQSDASLAANRGSIQNQFAWIQTEEEHNGPRVATVIFFTVFCSTGQAPFRCPW